MQDDDNINLLPIKVQVNLESKDVLKAFNKLVDVLVAPFKKLSSSKTIKSTDTYIANRILSKDIKKLAKELNINTERAVELAMRADSLNSIRLLREQENIERVVTEAIESVSGTVNDNPLEPDWFFDWLDGCKNITDEQLRTVWARLLAGELSEPGSFSRRTLGLTRMLSNYEATLFMKLRECLVCMKVDNTDQYYFVRTNAFKNSIWRYDLNMDDLLRLEQAGLLICNNDYMRDFITPYSFVYSNIICEIDSKPLAEARPIGGAVVGELNGRPMMQINMEAYPLTDVGNQIAKICEGKINRTFIEDLILTFHYNHPNLKIFRKGNQDLCLGRAILDSCPEECSVMKEEDGICS